MNNKTQDKNRESDETLARKEKYRALLDAGIEPYGRKFERTGNIAGYLENFKEGEAVSLAGRIVALRKQGKAMFLDFADFSGRMQLFIHKEKLGEEAFAFAKTLNVGDFIGINGELFLTRTEMKTVLALKITMLSKAIRPLPEKWHGLKDVETIYRQRYLDLVTNEESRIRFRKRAAIISAIREYMAKSDTIEVETPMLQALCGGAAANPFKTYYEALSDDFYMRIAPELFLKRLLVGGYERVFELNRSFRNEGLSRRHNPEFTMLEVYWAYEDYQTMMNLTEDLVIYCMDKVLGTREVTIGENTINFEKPWKRLTMRDSLKEYLDFDTTGMSAFDIAAKAGVELEKGISEDEALVVVFEEKVEHLLMGPVFITDYPASVCTLAKARKDDPATAERFELFINGFEIANAYSELNDPFIQRKNFEDQVKGHESEEAKVDEDYVTALEHGMPPAGGLGIGIDRLVMLLTGAESIRDVILFPQLKNK